MAVTMHTGGREHMAIQSAPVRGLQVCIVDIKDAHCVLIMAHRG